MNSATDRPDRISSVAVSEPVVRSDAGRKVLAALRIVVGFNFLWSFLDKALGLNYTTPAENAWFSGGSPTQGYLMGASDGPLGGMWETMAGNPVIDTLFMLALFGLGIAALFGAGLRVAAVAGMVLASFFYLSQLPLEAGAATNPVTTSHWYYFLMFPLFALLDAGRTWGVAGIWERVSIVRKAPWLR
jgi:thiosulfate dehydrogenase (quinone) large subunit